MYDYNVKVISLKLPCSLPHLPLYEQPPISPFTSPETSTPPPLPRSPSASPVSPGFPQPLRFTPEGGPGKLRPVRAAPPPPKQHPRRSQEKSDKTEEVEITLV
uniref:FCH and double SH3 domains 2 n=1 Tax=Cyclopterus lumpus TaxID=8103 RepID=A0A8C2X4J4_CYCLU